MSAATNRVRQVVLVLVVIGLGSFVVVQGRNFLVTRVYKGQVQDIQSEMRVYKGLTEVNTQMWSSDKEPKEIETMIAQVQKLRPASEELKKSRELLISALDQMLLAQKESGKAVSELHLEEDQDRFARAKEYLDEADRSSARSTEYLQKFEEAHKELFQ